MEEQETTPKQQQTNYNAQAKSKIKKHSQNRQYNRQETILNNNEENLQNIGLKA